jgi:hypothetical protein
MDNHGAHPWGGNIGKSRNSETLNRLCRILEKGRDAGILAADRSNSNLLDAKKNNKLFRHKK